MLSAGKHKAPAQGHRCYLVPGYRRAGTALRSSRRAAFFFCNLFHSTRGDDQMSENVQIFKLFAVNPVLYMMDRDMRKANKK